MNAEQTPHSELHAKAVELLQDGPRGEAWTESWVEEAREVLGGLLEHYQDLRKHDERLSELNFEMAERLDKLERLEEQLEAAQARESDQRRGASYEKDRADTALARLHYTEEQLEVLREALGAIATGTVPPTYGAGAYSHRSLAREVLNRVSIPASSPENVARLPVCSECAKGQHVYCLDDGTSTVECRCPCGDDPDLEYDPVTGWRRPDGSPANLPGARPGVVFDTDEATLYEDGVLRIQESPPAKERQ